MKSLSILLLSVFCANAVVQNNIVYVSPSGNDSTAVVGDVNLSCATFAKAKALAFPVAGTIVVEPGTYTENNILTNGVNYYFMAGSTLSYRQLTTNDAGWGLIDDRPCGATTNIISGYGNFKFMTYTGRVDLKLSLYNTNSLGVIVTTNPATVLHISGDTIDNAWFENVIHPSGFSGGDLDIINCQDVVASFRLLTDSYRFPSNTFLGWPFWMRTNGVIVTKKPIDSGVFWVTGNCHFDITENLNGGQYGIWGVVGANPISTELTNDASLWYTGDFMNHKIYMDNLSTSNNWRSWIVIKNLEWDGLNGYSTVNGASYYGPGKHYLTAQKILAGSDGCIDVQSSFTNTPQVWANIQKCSATNTWIDVRGGQLIANIGQFEDLGSIGVGSTLLFGGGIYVDQFGSADISFQTMPLTNNVQGSTGVYFGGNKLVLRGGTIDTRKAGAGSYPIDYHTNNVGIPTNELILQSVSLDSAKGVVGIHSTIPVTVKTFGVYESGVNSVTVNPLPASACYTNLGNF
jgi:hypothetical protein